MVAVETGEVLLLAVGVDGVGDGVAVALESCAGTAEKEENLTWSSGFHI